MSLTPFIDEELEEEQDVENDEEFADEESSEIEPTKTYRIDFQNKRILGITDDKDAVFQAIEKILNTDKYAYSIYDWYYGNDLVSLTGKPIEFVKSEIPRIITESLEDDDRIYDVTDFVITQDTIDSCSISFNVNTVYGEIPYGIEVEV